MQYRDTIFKLMMDNDPQALADWIGSHTELEQAAIYREIADMGDELVDEDLGEKFKEDVQQMKTAVQQYEDSILDEQVASLKLEFAEKDLEKKFEEADKAMDGIKNYITGCILNNEPNAPEMLELAKKIIESEKENGLYDAANWQAIAGYL